MILGQLVINMYGSLHDRIGTGARTLAIVPKKDWCRLAFVVNEYYVNKNSCRVFVSLLFFYCSGTFI